MKKTNLLKLALFGFAALFYNQSQSQIIIRSDVADANSNYSYVSNSDLTPVSSGSIEYFWFGSANLSTISSWTSKSDWLGSALYANVIGSQSIGEGYSGAAGLFGADVNIASLSTSAVGKFYAAAITTSDGLLGVFRFSGVLPDNRLSGSSPIPVAPAILADVNEGGVLVGSFNASGSLSDGDGGFFPAEAYILVPEPSTGALMMIGAVGLVALRRLRKV